MVITGVAYLFWLFGYLTLGDLSDIDRKLWIITANIKFISLVALYVAWRVTPDKNPNKS